MSTYWRHDNVVVNLGDYMTEYLLSKLGHEFVPFSPGRKPEFDHVLFAAGSVLAPMWLKSIDKPVYVWGSGCPTMPTERLPGEIVFYAVRGPLTRDVLGLPENTVLGDPAILLPRFYTPKPVVNKKIIYAPHCSVRDSLTIRDVVATGADTFCDITCCREDFENRISEIATAKFVLAGSLHAAIIAQVYGVPWALCVPFPIQLVMPFKHKEWAAYLNISPAIVSNYEEGADWWEKFGSKGYIPDSAAKKLLDVFPY